MATWHRLEPADASVFTSAPQLYRFTIDVDVAPERVWQSLASDESIAAWPLGAGLSIGLRWTSARPFGVDATREVTLPLGAATVRERFFRWDEGRGYSFYVEQINRPGFRRFAENYVIEPRGTGARLTWTVAIEPDARGARLSAVTGPINRFAFGRTAKAGKKYFAQHP
jgi:Polyketide cyclase / dehydrase and lipid transport